jgi:hypothetical protein
VAVGVGVLVGTLPPPVCRYGYTEAQLAAILGPRLAAFHAWHVGQTGAICEGGDGCAAPHGLIVYTHDVRQFLAGVPDLDGGTYG